MSEFNPRKMNYGQIADRQKQLDLCRSCLHNSVCKVYAFVEKLETDETWLIAIGNCAHYVRDPDVEVEK